MKFAMPTDALIPQTSEASLETSGIYHYTIALFIINYVSSHTINISHQMITKILNCLETSTRCKLKINSKGKKPPLN